MTKMTLAPMPEMIKRAKAMRDEAAVLQMATDDYVSNGIGGADAAVRALDMIVTHVEELLEAYSALDKALGKD